MNRNFLKFTAFLLITGLLCGLFGGCGEAVPKTTEETAERLLTKGYYAVYDADGVLTAYAEVKSSSVILYDTDGREKDDYKLNFDPVKDEYKLDYEEEFTVRERRNGLTVTFASKEKYRLESIAESELPVPSTRQALATTEAPTEPPATEAPATEAPTEPSTEATTEEPTTEAPTTEASTEPAGT